MTLPKCEHGNHLVSWNRERLEPECGCRIATFGMNQWKRGAQSTTDDINKDTFEVPAGPYRDQDGHDIVDAQGNPVICSCSQGADRLVKKLNEAFRLGYRAALMEKA